LYTGFGFDIHDFMAIFGAKIIGLAADDLATAPETELANLRPTISYDYISHDYRRPFSVS